MKKRLLAVSVLAVFGASAHAQSTVTLYGIIGEGFDFTDKCQRQQSVRASN